jgi:signal transduction histidine kinase
MSKEIHNSIILNPVTDTATSITEAGRQESLLRTGALQNAIFNSANFSSIATDAKGVIQIFNVGAERMLGYVAADVMNKITPADISDPEEVIARAKALSTELGTPITPGFEALVFKASRGIEDIYELTYIRKDGSRFPAVVSVTALRDDEGAIIGYLLIGTDNTARKRLEERVRHRTAELEATNKELEAFSYSVSHDLRDPLRSIDGFSQAFLEDFGPLVPPEGREDLQRVRHATQRMGQLIDDMLLLSRVTRREMHMEATDMSALAAEVAEELVLDNPQRDVQLSIEPGMTATGDPQLLHIVLVNLLGNAWKFTSRREHAHVSVGTVRDPEHGPAFFVHDDGAGFDLQYKDKLFVAFQRLHGQDEFPGTGIGLATVLRVARRHGGDVWAEGEVDRGATFCFTIPDLRASIPTKEEQP